MKNRPILILTLLTLAVFANSLFNDFIGDDNVVIKYNQFYTSWSNWPRLFQKTYLTDSRELFHHTPVYDSSGSVAYRPVLSTSFFVDHWLWKKNPFGYHLTSLILHVFNVLLVYGLLNALFRQERTALLGAILFSVHPTKVEAVCSIGYRADLLACLFFLCALHLFLRWARDGKPGLQTGSVVCYLAALFSKESAIVLPGILALYDYFFTGYHWKDFIRNFGPRYRGYVVAAFFYISVYVLVFPNTSLSKVSLMGGNIGTHVATALWIFVLYVKDLLLPFWADIVPPLWAPVAVFYAILKTAAALAVIGVFFKVIQKTTGTHKETAFFLSWFLLALLPVANIIPIANPMAHRFLYLPSIGLLAGAAVGIEYFCARKDLFAEHPKAKDLLKWGVVGACMAVTVPMNGLWKNNYTLSAAVIEHHPRYAKAYEIMGTEFFRVRAYDKAKVALEQAARLGILDARVYYRLGICSLKNPEEAEWYFRGALQLYPDYASAHLGLGRMFFLAGKYAEAVPYLKRTVELEMTYPGAAYLIQAYNLTGEPAKAREVLKKAKDVLTEPDYVSSLEKFVAEAPTLDGPIDVGI